MRRELDRSQSALDGSKARDDAADELREEKDDLMHRIRSLQADIEHNSAGRRTEHKEAERRRLDRELDRLRYEKLPELERSGCGRGVLSDVAGEEGKAALAARGRAPTGGDSVCWREMTGEEPLATGEASADEPADSSGDDLDGGSGPLPLAPVP